MGNHVKLNSKKKEFGKIFFYSVAGIFAFYLLLSMVTSHVVIVSKGILLFAFFLTTYTGFIISKTKFDFLIIFRIILLSLSMFIVYMCLLLSHISRAIFFLFVPIIIIAQILFSMRVSFFLAFFFLVLSFFITEISTEFKFALREDFYGYNPQVLKVQEYITLAIALYFSFFGLYYKEQFLKIELLERIEFGSDLSIEDDKFLITEEIDDSNGDKYELLYNRIIDCLEVEKPYHDPEFNIRKLADLLGSNSTYVSRSLNQIGNKKFNHLINEYRIRQVLEELKNDMHQKFTIEHIYTNAGFSQQSTFNRIFKEHTGRTPSEYIKNSSK